MKFDCARIAPPRFLQSIFSVRNATGCMKKTMEAGKFEKQNLISHHPLISTNLTIFILKVCNFVAKFNLTAHL